MKKQCKVVMLPTSKAIENGIIKDHNNNLKVATRKVYGKTIFDVGVEESLWRETHQPQHLYFISNEKVRNKDYYISTNNIIIQNTLNKDISQKSFIKGKIIASTNPSLNLPRPSNEFIKKYCQEKGEIKEAAIECEVKTMLETITFNPGTLNEYTDLSDIDTTVAKTAPDNTVSIYPIKESWNKEEVIELCRKWYENGWHSGQRGHEFCHTTNTTNTSLEDWIKQEL